MLILFFDTYIVSGLGERGGFHSHTLISRELGKYRDVLPSYAWQDKIEVVKYTLLSYSFLHWDKVIIRFECEDVSSTSAFETYCRSLFPEAIIQNERSDTAMKYANALDCINCDSDPWIFFSPNNDHPYIYKEDLLKKYLEIGDLFVKKFPHSNVSINYSHYTESVNDNGFLSPQYGYHMNVFKKIIFENDDAFVSSADNITNDSVRMYKLSFLKDIFKNTKNNGRVIRIEDTEFYVSNKTSIVISPKVELCRHFDSYTHIINRVPPLFIPPGFWEHDIKIKYGYDNNITGYLNINPKKEFVSPQTDCLFLISDIPMFWRNRISKISINEEFIEPSHNQLLYYKYLNNPWLNNSIARNFLRSLIIVIKYKIKNQITNFYQFIKGVKSCLH